MTPPEPPRASADGLSGWPSGWPSVDQVYGALTALGVTVVLDSARWPDGPKDTDRPLLLGMLLAAGEMSAAAGVSPDNARDFGRGYALAGADGAGADALVRFVEQRALMLRSVLDERFDTDHFVAVTAARVLGCVAGLLRISLLLTANQAGDEDADPDGQVLLSELKGVDTDLAATQKLLKVIHRELGRQGFPRWTRMH